MVGLDIADKVEKKQMETYGFGFAETQKYVQSVNVPILFLQVKKDKYTFDPISGNNDIELIIDSSKPEHKIISIEKRRKNILWK